MKITYELYINDYIRRERQTLFVADLEELQNWIVKNYYYHEVYSMGRDVPSSIYYGNTIDFPSTTLNFYNGARFTDVWIHTIEDNEGNIIFSSGKYTQGIKHIAKEVKDKFEEWKKEDKEDPKHLKRLGFKFKE